MPKGTRKIRFYFEESHLTHFGGMWLIQLFCKYIGLKKRLQEHVRFPQRNQDYHASELILALMFAIVMGLRRINKTEILQYNGAFLEMLGLKRFPDQSTLCRFLKRLPNKTIRQLVRLHDSLRAYLFGLPRMRHSLIFNIDSAVLVIYGKHEGARVGYNPKKHGRRSYHPLFCFEAGFEEFWHGSLRPGDAASSTGIIPFLKVCLAKVPKTIARSRIRFRMDSGFHSRETVEFLDGKKCGYVIVVKEGRYKVIQPKAVACKFTKLKNGWEVGEFWFRPNEKWKEKHRFVVARRPIPEDPVEAKQLTLFKDTKYAYHVFITNLTTSAWRVYRFYLIRANIEKHIRELVYDYPLAKIPTRDWTANVAFFQTILFASNLVHWFKRLCLPKQWRFATLDTIRTDFLMLPAKLTKRGSQ
ncbi:MAG: IS1380 family transposase, partial [Elusimicrobia bacterium]|nr:IS1380 family transposase [Elusimicrobiota bacterium]